MSNKSKLKDNLKKNASLIGAEAQNRLSDRARNALNNKRLTSTGGLINEVNGGIQSLTQNFDKFQGGVTDLSVQGLLGNTSKSIDNLTTSMVDETISNITSKLSSYTKVTFEEVNIGGIRFNMPSTSELASVGGSNTTISDVLKKITGLDVGSGDLQKQVVNASPEGLLRAGVRIEGKVGAFSASDINSKASATITSVTDVLETTGAVGEINQRLSFPTTVDSDGIMGDSTQVADTRPTNANEFAEVINNAKTKSLASLETLVTKGKETKQNLVAGAADFSALSGGKDGQTVINDTREEERLRQQFIALADERNSLIQSRVAGDGQTGILQSLSIEILTDIRKRVKEFAPTLSDVEVNRVILLSQGDSQEFSEAVDIIFNATGKSAQEIRAFLKTIDTTIARAVSPAISIAVLDEPYVIGSFAKEWNNGQGNPTFPYVSSVEELQAEMRNIQRDVTEVVVHWSETPTNKNIGSEEINAIHLENGLNGIGYHYVIRRDGSLQRGRPVNIQGEHSVKNGHNDRSIGIVFVGGINVPSETPNLLDFLSVQSLTRSQFNTFDHFCRAFYNVFSGGQILGHSDVDELTNDPGFDVRAYVKANFDKDSKFTDPTNQGPFTVDEINS